MSTEAGRKPPIIVVHGLWMQGPDTWLLRRRLRAAGYATHVFRYRSVFEDLDVNAERLAEFAARTPGDTVHFVGHSLGGVLILWMLRRLGFARAGRVVCLGSPLTGSQMAVAFGRWPGGPRMLGKSIAGLLANGGLGRWEGDARVGIIAGSRPLGFGRLVKRLSEVNDGVVTVDETRLPGVADHIVLHTCHMGLLVSKATVDQTLCFLEHGAFCHERVKSAAAG